MLGTPRGAALSAVPPALTTILPPAPWLFTLTPSHWFSLLSRCRSTVGDRSVSPAGIPPLEGMGNPPRDGEAPPGAQLTSLVDGHPPAVGELRGQWASKEPPSPVGTLARHRQRLGGPHQQPGHGRDLPIRVWVGGSTPHEPQPWICTPVVLGLHTRPPPPCRQHPWERPHRPHAAVPAPPPRFHAVAVPALAPATKQLQPSPGLGCCSHHGWAGRGHRR